MILGFEWDAFGRLVTAVGLVAMVAYLIPGMMTLPLRWERRMQIAAIALLVVALVMAIGASIAWFSG